MKRRLPQLDALRTLAIILVLGRHVDRLPPDYEPIALHVFTLWKKCGWCGVNLFFVLSGYLISGLLFREYARFGRVNLKRFLIRRAMKIYPAFYVLLIFTCIVALRSHVLTTGHTLAEALFVQNYFPGYWSHTWSLATEEQFYLAASAAVAVLLFRKATNPFKFVPILTLVICAACLVFRFAMLGHARKLENDTQIFPAHLTADALMFGVLLSYWDQFHHLKFRAVLTRFRIPIMLASLALVAPVLMFSLEDYFMPTAGLTCVYLGCGGIIMLSIHSATAEKSKLISALGRVGFFSYSIYLWHIPWRHFFPLAHVSDSAWWPRWCLYFFGSIIVGIAMAKLIEMPVLYLRDRYFPSEIPPLSQ